MKKTSKLLSIVLALGVLLSCVSVPVTFAADEAAAEVEKVKTLDDYPDEVLLLDANDKKSIESFKGLKAAENNTNEKEYSAEWKLKSAKTVDFKSVTDISGFGKLEFYLCGDEKHPTTLSLIINAQNPDTEGSDYYTQGTFEVKPGWNKYEFDLAAIQKKRTRTPNPFYEIDTISLYATGWGMDAINNFDETVLYLDSVKLIKGDKLLAVKPVIQPETEAGTAKYFEYDFEVEELGKLEGLNANQKTNKISIAGKKGEKYLKIETLTGESDCYVDVPVKYTKRYSVISADFKFDKFANGQLFALKDKTNAQERSVKFNSDGTITASGKAATLKEGEWVNIAMCVDVLSHVYSIYVNGKLYKENIQMSNQTLGNITVVRIFMNPNDYNGAVGIDNFKMFDGKTPADYEKAVDAPSASTAENIKVEEPVKNIDVNSDATPAYKQVKSNAVAEVADAVCLKVNSPFALVRHEQKAIDENNKEVVPFIINGRTLVPVRFISEAFGAEVAWDDATRTVTVKKDSDVITLVIGSNILNKNGTDITIDVPAEIYNDRTMLPLRAVTENLGKKVFWDDLGLIIISDNEINFTKEKDLNKMLDIMAGFTYERPGREKIKADILAATPNHPRILATASDFARIKDYLAYDANIQTWVGNVITSADKYAKAAPTDPLPTYASDAGGRLANNYAIQEKAFILGMAYQLTGDTKYVDAMWYTLEPMCKWEHWHPGHFLNAAYVMWGAAIAYDWMYDAWTPEQKAIIEEALYDCGIEDSITAYYGANDYLSPPMGVWHRSGWWSQGNNWNAVCNAGVVAAGLALATHETYGDLAVKAIDFAMNGFEVGLRCYAPDGGYEEGPSYWAYGTNNAILLMAALTSATGSSYGLSDAPGFNVTYSTPLYSESKQGMFNYSDAAVSRTDTASLFWFGKEYGDSKVNGIRFNELATGDKASSWKDVLWYNPDNIDTNASLALDYSFFRTDTLTLRSSWTDSNQLFVGLHGGSNTANHCNIDSGTFVLDALNTRWFMDFGSDNYNLPNYWSTGTGGLRWQYYVQRAEGHNTFVINPGDKEDQVIQSVSKITEVVSKPRGAYGKLDLTPAYATDATKAIRGTMLTANRKAAIIQDEITMKKPSEFYWFAHTKAAIDIAEDGRSAILTLGAKKLHCQIVTDDANMKFTVMDSVSLPTSPVPPASETQKETSRTGVRKLVIHGSGVEKVNLAVVFQPMSGDVLPEYSYTYTALDDWSVPDGDILTPKLESITVDGALIEGYNRDITSYEVVLPYGTTTVPEVAATPDALSNCVVTAPETLPGTAVIKVMNNEDATMYSIYNVFIRPENEVELEVSDAQEGNGPENCMDGLLGTRWAVEGEAWGIFHFAVPKKISSVWIAVWKANQRKQIFDIEVSEDGVNFTQVFSGQSKLDKDELEEYKIPEGTYKAVKVVLHGTTTGSWNSLLEVEFK